MKIFVVTSLSRFHTAGYLIQGLREVGCTVKVCSDIPHDLADVIKHGAVHVPDILSNINFNPDAILFIEGGTMQVFPVALEQVNCLTAWYGIDTHMDYRKHLSIGRLFDITFVAQKEYVARLKADGLLQVEWLPLGFPTELLPASPPDRTFDIAYVGSDQAAVHPERHALLQALRRERFTSWFGRASPREMGRIYSSAKVVFNKSIHNDVNMRVFEAAGCGAVLVTDRISDNGIEELFDEGVHYVTYSDESSLVAIVKELLSDSVRCALMGDSARRHVLERHTYRHRAQRVLEVIKQGVKRARPEPEEYIAVLLALNLLSDAIQVLARSLSCASKGRYRRYAGWIVGGLLCGVAGMLGVIEHMRRWRMARSFGN
ncbi:MAG: glycosyltransferase [Nitrospira sp.]|nr:glycosyltransferase [Nitrospira sp.]